MNFKRKLDSSFPVVYDTWKVGDSTFVIQDLPPEDDEKALAILVADFLPDETICSELKIHEDPQDTKDACDFWRDCFSQRMSLACYVEKNGVRTLAGVNVCIVLSKGEEHHCDYKSKWQYVYDAVMYVENKRCCFEYLGTDPVLFAMGLVVKREYRGANLGPRLLDARKPLSIAQGVKATATVFTSPGGQKTAEKSGFTTIAEATMKDLADAGLPYPTDDRCFKYMVKKFKE